VADKQDSQDICFVPSGRYAQMIERLRPGAAEPGDIVDVAGSVLGRHDGIIHFTVGQRRGLRIATGHPLYVVRLDAATRRVVVGAREALRISSIKLRDVNWLGDGTLADALAENAGEASEGAGANGAGIDRREVFVRVRSTRPPQPAWLRLAGGSVEVELVAGEDGVSPGQACVFYDAPGGQARVLGGGIIHSAAASRTPAREAVAGRAAARG
jgi:tRNA-specific 2-thiouridylase